MLPRLYFVFYIIFCVLPSLVVPISVSEVTAIDAPSVSTTDDTNTRAIEGFGTTLRCFVNTCLRKKGSQIKWYKFNDLISENLVPVQKRYEMQYSRDLSNDCAEQCQARSQICPTGQSCRITDSMCCKCSREEYSIFLKNLTFADSGSYRCQLEGGNNITTRLLVLERSSLMDIDTNITYDHKDCCKRNGMSKQCMNMCVPKLIETERFDPMPCQKEFGKLLSCTTDNGNVSHIHCCKLRLVPAFCWDYCSNKQTDLSNANKMCVFWLPEIMQCFEQAYLPLPGHPENLIISQENETALEACWDMPEMRGETVKFYTLHYQEVPIIPLFGAGIPLGRFGAPSLPTSPEVASSKEVVSNERKKRQSVFITMRNLETNQTNQREYKFLKLNTTDTCAMVTDLQPSTQYAFYVTATNDYGEGLPSLKELSQTQEANYANDSMPDVLSCCKREGVSQQCADRMCDMTKPPSSAIAFELAFTCRKEFPKVSPCLADKRDHTDCCREKGVFGDCLKFCNGSAENLGMASILCLTFDVQSIFGCFRRGYIALPSPPSNITVNNILATSATVIWDTPETNGHMVANYSLFYGKDVMNEVTNVVSPYQMTNLMPDTVYNVYVVAKAEKGSSLKSSTAAFRTTEPILGVCQSGKPLLDGSNSPINCAGGIRCPSNYKCVAVRSDVPNTKYCCPVGRLPVGPSTRIQEPNVTECCLKRKVSPSCSKLCSYSTGHDDIEMADFRCSQYIDEFAECGSDGRNNFDCCKKAGVPDKCLDFCLPPLKKPIMDYIDCLPHTEKIVTCVHEGVLYRPGKPLGVSVEDQGPDWFTVHWLSPAQTVTVQKYEVKINNYSMANTSGRSLTFSGLKMNKRYEVKIVAWNVRGSSMPSDSAVVNLTGDTKSPSEDYKPRVPYSITKVWYREGAVNLTWSWKNQSVNGLNLGKVKFIVSYIDHPGAFGSGGEWKNVTTESMFVILKDMPPNKNIDVRVKAINEDKGIEGLFSEITVIKAVEVDRNASIEMWTDPSGYIKSGDTVEIHCVAKGSVVNRTMVMRKGPANLISGVGNLTLTLKNIKPEYGLDPISCTINNGGQILQATQNLKIRYSPTMESTDTKELKALEDSQISMLCVFRGFPTPDVDWLKFDGKDKRTTKLKDDQNHQITNNFDDYRRNAFVNQLTIARVKSADSGAYMCKACNEIGCLNRTINLLVEPVNSPTGPDQVMDCCKKSSIKEKCKQVCSESVLSFTQMNDESCDVEFYKMFGCYSVLLDASTCCRSSAVTGNCLSYCSISPFKKREKEISEDARCKQHELAVSACLEREYLMSYPDAAEIKNVTNIGDGKVNLSWSVDMDREKNLNDKPIHVVYYKEKDDDTYKKITTREQNVIIPVNPNAKYSFTMLSKNSKGFGEFAPIVSYNVPYFTSQASSSGLGSGAIFVIILILLLVSSFALSFVYFSRRPQRMPTGLLKIFKRNHPGANGAVAFENPGYDVDEGHVHGLPGDPIIPSTNIGAKFAQTRNGGDNGTGSFANAAYESSNLETPGVDLTGGSAGDENQQRASATSSKYNQLLS